MKTKKTALVLEGGGMRGAYTAGALSWLIDEGIEFDGAYGISTGAVHLCSYLLKSKELLFGMSTRGITDKEIIGLRAILHEGRIVAYDYLFKHIINGRYSYPFDKLKEVLCKAMIGVYDLGLGKTVYINVQDSDSETLKAASSLPILGKIVRIDGREYLDGGITEMIPIKKAMEDGYENCLVITTKPKEYVRKPANKLVVWIMKMFYPQCENISKDYAVRHLNYVDQIERINSMVDNNMGLYVYPTKTSNVTRLGGSIEELEELYELGRSDMEKQRDKIIELFK